MRIGFIGGGIMGLPMALNLVKNGFDVTLYNRTYEKIAPFREQIKVVETLDELIENKDVIFSIVGYPSEVEQLYCTLFDKVNRGTILVDMTTSSPKLAKKLYLFGKDKGIHVIDAPVTGGDLGAKNGQLSIMVGGEEAIFLTIKPMLEAMGKTITYMGESGNGQYMKLTNQIVIASNIIGIAEAITFAKDHDLSLDAVLNVIGGGSASSWQAIHNGRKMIEKDYNPGFFVKHFLKDLRLALDEMKTPLTNLAYAESIYAKLKNHEYGTQAIILHYLNQD